MAVAAIVIASNPDSGVLALVAGLALVLAAALLPAQEPSGPVELTAEEDEPLVGELEAVDQSQVHVGPHAPPVYGDFAAAAITDDLTLTGERIPEGAVLTIR